MDNSKAKRAEWLAGFFKIMPEVYEYEPHEALKGGVDGLDFYRRIIDEAHLYLKPGGFLILELGVDEKEDVLRFIDKSGNYRDLKIFPDFLGIPRVLIAGRK